MDIHLQVWYLSLQLLRGLKLMTTNKSDMEKILSLKCIRCTECVRQNLKTSAVYKTIYRLTETGHGNSGNSHYII